MSVDELLQRGRAPESAEMLELAKLERIHITASTGPRSGERGDLRFTAGMCRTS